MMKKAVNKFALVLWLLAAGYVIVEVWGWYYFVHYNTVLANLHAAPKWPPLLKSPVNVFVYAAILAALGMLIEIGDKIRWLLERKPN